MADTRCANPEYQLDVDVMTLEYTVYKTIEATFPLLRSLVKAVNDGVDGKQRQSPSLARRHAEATRLHQICDSLIRSFQDMHPKAILTPACDYNLRLLEFQVLLTYWIPRSSRTRVGPGSHWQWPYTGSHERQNFVWPPPLCENLLAELDQSRIFETVMRRNWLGIHYRDEGLPSDPELQSNPNISKRRRLNSAGSYNGTNDTDSHESSDDGASDGSNDPSETPLFPTNVELPALNVGVSHGARKNRRLRLAPRSYGGKEEGGLFMLNLFDLMPRFMDLSAGIAQALGNVNSHWTELACRFMHQSALERMQNMRENHFTKPTDAPFLRIVEDFGNRTWIEECFAWGTTSDLPSNTSSERIRRELAYLGNTKDYPDGFIKERLRTEDLVCAMLNSAVDMQDSDRDTIETLRLHPNAADPTWTTLRKKYLEPLLNMSIIKLHGSQFRSFRRPVQDLCEEHPIKPFLFDLVRYLEGVWACNVSPGIGGKPVLVQIEEGGLEGLGPEKFDEFLARVGLRKSHIKEEDGKVRVSIKWAK